MTSAVSTAGRALTRRRVPFYRRHSYFFALVFTALLLATNLIIQPHINWPYQLATFAPLAIAAMASTPAVISGRGGLDISISPMMTLISVIYPSVLLPAGLGGYEAFPIFLAFGGLLGALNGALIVWLRLPAIVVTLAMYSIFTGAAMKIAPVPMSIGHSWVPIFAKPMGPVPGALVLIGVPLVIWYALARTVLGRMLFAVGSNDATALASGIRVDAIRITAFSLGGVMAGVGALAILALVRVADPSQATAYTLVAIAAVALGGTVLTGGRGGLIGSFFGAACIFLLQSLLTVMQVSQALLGVFYGGLLLVSIILGAGLVSKSRDAQ